MRDAGSIIVSRPYCDKEKRQCNGSLFRVITKLASSARAVNAAVVVRASVA